MPAALIDFLRNPLSAPLQDHRLPRGSRRGSAGRSTCINNPENGSANHGFPFIFGIANTSIGKCHQKI